MSRFRSGPGVCQYCPPHSPRAFRGLYKVCVEPYLDGDRLTLNPRIAYMCEDCRTTYSVKRSGNGGPTLYYVVTDEYRHLFPAPSLPLAVCEKHQIMQERNDAVLARVLTPAPTQAAQDEARLISENLARARAERAALGLTPMQLYELRVETGLAEMRATAERRRQARLAKQAARMAARRANLT